jgi:hypothetical protein
MVSIFSNEKAEAAFSRSTYGKIGGPGTDLIAHIFLCAMWVEGRIGA